MIRFGHFVSSKAKELTIKMQRRCRNCFCHEDNEKLEKKLTEAVKENEELQQKLIILEQDWQYESNLYSKTCHRFIESERRKMNLNAQLDEVHNKWVEEKKRSQELLNQKSATDAKTQQLENKARNKDTRIIELERKIKNSGAAAKESESKYSNNMAELDSMRGKHRKESNARIGELKSKLEALENRKLEEQVNLTTSDDQVPTKPESSIFVIILTIMMPVDSRRYWEAVSLFTQEKPQMQIWVCL